jgi:hypothetical protein
MKMPKTVTFSSPRLKTDSPSADRPVYTVAVHHIKFLTETKNAGNIVTLDVDFKFNVSNADAAKIKAAMNGSNE